MSQNKSQGPSKGSRVSHQAKSAFDFIIEQAIRSSMLGDGASASHIEKLSDGGQIKNRQMVILTVSSYLFRAMMFLHFNAKDPATRAHFAALKGQSELDDATFLDVVMETGNLACGALNRDLGGVYPHLGMSTPSVLDHGSLEYIEALGAGHVAHWRVTTASQAVFHVSLAVCEDGPLDFTVDQTQVEESSGELEFF